MWTPDTFCALRAHSPTGGTTSNPQPVSGGSKATATSSTRMYMPVELRDSSGTGYRGRYRTSCRIRDTYNLKTWASLIVTASSGSRYRPKAISIIHSVTNSGTSARIRVSHRTSSNSRISFSTTAWARACSSTSSGIRSYSCSTVKASCMCTITCCTGSSARAPLWQSVPKLQSAPAPVLELTFSPLWW